MKDSLEDLLDRLGGSDFAAAEQVFRAYEPYLRKVVRRQLSPELRPKFDSADVVQSVWADVLGRFQTVGYRFTDAAHLRAFLLTATRNRFIDRVRQHRAATERERPLEGLAPEKVPAARQERPSELAQANELWERMLRLCPPAHRLILELKRQGLPMAEVAARTGLHEDSIRRILRELACRLAMQAAPSAPT
jgi:RNA polymerase sigma-70 factor (ECF subfamily)